MCMNDKVRLTITFPKDLYAQIKEMALKNRRSFTSQVVYMVEHSEQMAFQRIKDSNERIH